MTFNYDPHKCSVILCAGTEQEIVIEGFSTTDEINFNREKFWHKLLRVEDCGTHVVELWDNSFNFSFASFTKEGYDKHIKDLKPSVESPFKFNKVDP